MEIAITQGITVAVEHQYLPEHSDQREHRFVFGYHIRIENGSPYTVQLLRRHWYITDAASQLREVEGEGVVGEQPVLLPGEHYQYTSYCDLNTDMGKMRGTYLMTRREDGGFFEVEIPEFKMVAPSKLN
ncbi:MAG: Co2+/Mg2+ efflux protein ApaG [Saprospiraceae bacterium]|nr:Co2+/Mg2+ efflux protein ApaG [Saprospiraceae bacterium]